MMKAEKTTKTEVKKVIAKNKKKLEKENAISPEKTTKKMKKVEKMEKLEKVEEDEMAKKMESDSDPSAEEEPTAETITEKKEKVKLPFKKKTKIDDVPAPLPKYEEYRLADIISTSKWREDDLDRESSWVEVHYYRKDGTLEISHELDEDAKETLQQYIFRLFPDSIAAQYLRKTKRINDLNVLTSILDGYVKTHKTPVPADDVMVMHMRVGDVIDGTDVPVDDFFMRRVNSYYALFGFDPEGWSPVYVRCLASFDRALKKTKELGIHKIALVYGFHIICPVRKSRKYLAGLVDYAKEQGFEVELITHSDADVSFAYACAAKHFIPGGGGFSKLMAKVVRHKGNDVYLVRV